MQQQDHISVHCVFHTFSTDTVNCTEGNFIQEFMIRFGPRRGSVYDDDALNQVYFRCQDNTKLTSFTANETGKFLETLMGFVCHYFLSSVTAM